MNNRELFLYANARKSRGGSSATRQILSGLISRTITEITVPNQTAEIGTSAFTSCEMLTAITIPTGIINIGTSAFASCTNLKSIVIPGGTTTIRGYAFRNCTSLETLILPNSLSTISSNAFDGCNNLSNIQLENGFKANLNISASTCYTTETLVAMISNLADRNSQTAGTLTLGSDNLIKLTDEQIAVATQKNWTLA